MLQNEGAKGIDIQNGIFPFLCFCIGNFYIASLAKIITFSICYELHMAKSVDNKGHIFESFFSCLANIFCPSTGRRY